MKSLIILALLAGAGYIGWQAGGGLDTDALGMAVGIVLGAVAAVPTALFVMAGSRRGPADEREGRGAGRHRARESTGESWGMIAQQHSASYEPEFGSDGESDGYDAQAGYRAQPPVIVLAGAGTQGAMGHSAFGLPAHGVGAWGEPRTERRFKVVGEQEAWIDEW